MGKVIIILVILGLIYFFFIKKPSVVTEKKGKKTKEKLDEETMIECKKCGVYVSVKDSIIKDGVHYCSKECAGVK